MRISLMGLKFMYENLLESLFKLLRKNSFAEGLSMRLMMRRREKSLMSIIDSICLSSSSSSFQFAEFM